MSILADFIFCVLLWLAGFRVEDAQLAAGALVLIAGLIISRKTGAQSGLCRWGTFAGAVLGLLLRSALVGLLLQKLGFSPWVVFAAAALCSGAWNRYTKEHTDREIVFNAKVVLTFSLVFRLMALGLPELIPQEAYYWNYAQHPALGYLDHPPLSAWLISATTELFGDTEYSVRLGALLCSTLSLVFVSLLTKRIFGTQEAWTAAALFAALPYFFGAGFLISPDAPLLTCWAAALCCIVIIIRAKADQQCWAAWIGVGLALGLGMLSKYTISLVAISSVITFLWHPPLRRWFFRPQPYTAVLISAAVFSPVLYWNATHDWASFVFQGSRRMSSARSFGLPFYLAQLLLLATPSGIAAAIYCLLRSRSDSATPKEIWRFSVVFFAFPVLLFLLYSLTHSTKMIWAGPAFLTALPLLARDIIRKEAQLGSPAWLRKSWAVMVPLSLICFGLLVYYSTFGAPGLNFQRAVKRLIGWSSLGERVHQIAKEMAAADGKRPLIVGMDKHYTAAELAFYTKVESDQHGQAPLTVTGRNLVGLDALMFYFWAPPQDLKGQDALLVARSASDLALPAVSQSFEQLDQIEEFQSARNDKQAGRYYLRRVYGYRYHRPPPSEAFLK